MSIKMPIAAIIVTIATIGLDLVFAQQPLILEEII